ncbi:Calx-beta domain-containing protein [Bythopirellula polymerisocia]|uniref:Calx-beta domain protein n=1 Tax=Bythopirellula polymerisocia TaxID=2528003 RepID=A0A5C6CWQ9_9BACT|nr:Calx-beta domain-containing protein [Bythopirellula polymerisocia]TWU27446.1 Calx-beta domain protein [Bythopirellula polymerisocia]
MSRKSKSSNFGKRRNRKSNKSAKSFNGRRSSLTFENLEDRRLMAVTSFQDIAGGYQGTRDTGIFSISPDVNFGGEVSISPDQQDANGVRQALLQFDGIFGNGPGQIPLGATINSASIDLSVVNPSRSGMQMSFYRMLTPWTENTATWNSFGEIGGVQASENEATDLPPDFVLFDPSTGVKSIDVTLSLQSWSAGQANNGWMIESAATDGWDFETSEAAQANRPKLTVNWTAPSGAGQITLLNTKPRFAEGNSGNTIAMINVSRLGGVTGAVSANYSLTAGSAAAGTDFVLANGVVNFADGQTSASIAVEIIGDTALEGNENFTVTLSNPTGGATLGDSVATATIADDDALINEILANVSDDPNENTITIDETNREYIELIGTPGASLDGYYFVVFEGEEEENGGFGAGSGIADIVIDLTGKSFGSNGLLVITPTNWAYTAAPGTAVFATSRLDGNGGVLEDASQTYALIRSSVPLVEGTDYDTVGSYATTNDLTETGLGVGLLDHPIFLDGTAQIVDTVGVVEGGSDRDRTVTSPELGLPGIHIHQPQGLPNSSGVTPDAITRRFNNFQSNTIGAWYNGDIVNTQVTNNPIQYLNGSIFISVVAPQGAVLTPGAHNILRNVEVTADLVSVDETSGQATFTVTRSGDLTSAINVGFETVNGTAQAGSDFVGKSGVLNFGVGVATQPITVTINDDGVPEGFETFSIRLTSVDEPFLIVGSPAVVTINDADVEAAKFQQNVNGFNSTVDTYIDASLPNSFFLLAETITADNAAGEGEGAPEGADIRPQQGLIRFDNIFGNAPGQVPEGAQIFGAFMTVNVLSPSSQEADIRFVPMLQDWDGFATWTLPNGGQAGTIVNGVTLEGSEAAARADSRVTTPGQAGKVQVPLNVATLQAWANGSMENHGWVIVNDSLESWTIGSSRDGSQNPFAPELTILYTNPSATSGEGEFQLSSDQVIVNEGSTATVTVQRVGGTTGAASVSWAVTPGTGSLGDLTGPLSGTLNFAANELSKTFNVATVQDTLIEKNETFNITLNSPSIGATISPVLGSSILTIRDNDSSTTSPHVLMSEVVYNQPGNDGGAEFIELVGTPGAGLGSWYAVVIGGDVGDDEGATNLVVDLGQYEIGANGTVLIGSQNNFTWDIPAGTTFIGLPELDVEFVGGNDNGTSTYALIYSPLRELYVGNYDYDWDNDGGLDLPLGASIVDSIGIKDNSAEDTTYGGGSNTIITNPVESYDALSRLPNSTARNNAASWYAGDLIAGDDALVYTQAFSQGLPSPGAAATPGLLNTGTNAQNPLVSLGTVSTTGGVQVSFTGTIQQVVLGDLSINEAGAGISITNISGNPVPGIDQFPQVTGYGTNTLSLSFTGAQTIGGQLPAGTYNLNFVGNGLVGNGRAVDVSGNGTTGSDTVSSVQITIAASANSADFDGDGDIDGRDFLSWLRGYGTSPAAKTDGDADNDADVDGADLAVWQGQYGTSPLLALGVEDGETQAATEEVTTSFALTGNTWLAIPTALATSEVTDAALEDVFDTEPSQAALTDSVDALFNSQQDDSIASFGSEEEEEKAFDEAFAVWDELTFAAV